MSKKPRRKYTEISIKQYGGAKDFPEMTEEDAVDLLGWREAKEGELPKLKDLEGKDICQDNNTTNRPLRLALAKDYAVEMLRKKWRLNGETMVVDEMGHIQSAQHRLTALILANQMLRENPARWEKYGTKGAVTIPAIVITGISSEAAVVDTLDQGKSRSLGDVLFRRNEFPDAAPMDQIRMSITLSYALRLVWLRTTNKKVADAPKFPPSEALDFLEAHPELKESVEFVWGEREAIQRHMSLGYAAGLHYLMSLAKTDPDNREDLNFSLRNKADEFFVLLGSCDSLGKGHPIQVLAKDVLPNLDAGSGSGRDEIVGCVIKAWNLFIDGKVKGVLPEQVAVAKEFDEDRNRYRLTERPRIGGVDTPYSDAEINRQLVELRGWKKGDTGWCKDADGTIFLAQVKSVKKDGTLVIAPAEEEEEGWTAEITKEQISVDEDKADDLEPLYDEEEYEEEEGVDPEEAESDEYDED